jgi:VanZ family protein
VQKYIKLIVWLIIIFYISLIPSEKIPDYQVLSIPYFDKMVHFGIYFVLSVLFASLLVQLKYNKIQTYIIVILPCAIIGGGIEILQNILPFHRSGSHLDFLADFLGTITGLVIYFKLLIYSKIDKYL